VFLPTTTPGEPRSIKKLHSASSAAGCARTDSCSQVEGTLFYATEISPDQFAKFFAAYQKCLFNIWTECGAKGART
jgi:hypothetical protein